MCRADATICGAWVLILEQLPALWEPGDAAMISQKGPGHFLQSYYSVTSCVSLTVDSRSCAHTPAATRVGERRFVVIFSFWGGKQVLLCKVVIPRVRKRQFSCRVALKNVKCPLQVSNTEGIAIRRQLVTFKIVGSGEWWEWPSECSGLRHEWEMRELSYGDGFRKEY